MQKKLVSLYPFAVLLPLPLSSSPFWSSMTAVCCSFFIWSDFASRTQFTLCLLPPPFHPRPFLSCKSGFKRSSRNEARPTPSYTPSRNLRLKLYLFMSKFVVLHIPTISRKKVLTLEYLATFFLDVSLRPRKRAMDVRTNMCDSRGSYSSNAQINTT